MWKEKVQKISKHKLNFNNQSFSCLAAPLCVVEKWLQTYFAFNGTNSRRTRIPLTGVSARRPTSPM